MSKIKMSFSLILTIILVGIISTAVFARSAYGLSVAPDGKGGFNFNFTKISTDTATDFTLNVYKVDPTTKALVTTAVFTQDITGTTTLPVNVPKENIAVGTIYDFVLTHTTGGDVVGEKFGVLTNSDNLKLANVADAGGQIEYTKADGSTVLLDINGSGLANVNHTGADSNRTVNGTKHKVHGFYQNNSNSCAACHQTHTAADGEYLLFKDGIYSTCSACHDGTTGAYNSFEVANEETVNGIAGTFNVHGAGQNGSLHVADGSLNISAAPGGNHVVNSTNTSTWGAEFDCASCHNPHGGGSASENNLSQDPMGWGRVTYVANGTSDQQNGKLFKGITVKTSAPTTFDTPYILVKEVASGVDAATKTSTKYLYQRAGVKDGDQILQTYKWDGGKYVPDFSLWLRALGYGAKANTVLKDSTGNDITATNMKVVWRDGFAFGSGVVDVVSADLSVGIDVETSGDVATLFDSANPGYIVDSGAEMSKYCASCHTDYLSATRTNNTGLYSLAHRHQSTKDSTTCVRCHYGHGSQAQIMKDANDNNYFGLTTDGVVGADGTTKVLTEAEALAYLKDANPSSALKRYTNMSVCYGCHGLGETFLSNPNIGPDSTTGQYLMGGQPGTTRTAIKH